MPHEVIELCRHHVELDNRANSFVNVRAELSKIWPGVLGASFCHRITHRCILAKFKSKQPFQCLRLPHGKATWFSCCWAAACLRWASSLSAAREVSFITAGSKSQTTTASSPKIVTTQALIKVKPRCMPCCCFLRKNSIAINAHDVIIRSIN